MDWFLAVVAAVIITQWVTIAPLTGLSTLMEKQVKP
jgi:hypothetical protein